MDTHDSHSLRVPVYLKQRPVIPCAIVLNIYNSPSCQLVHRQINLIQLIIIFRNQDIFKEDATFYIRNEIYQAATLSLESVNYPGYFVKTTGSRVRLEQYEDTNNFKNTASFTSKFSIKIVFALNMN